MNGYPRQEYTPIHTAHDKSCTPSAPCSYERVVGSRSARPSAPGRRERRVKAARVLTEARAMRIRRRACLDTSCPILRAARAATVGGRRSAPRKRFRSRRRARLRPRRDERADEARGVVARGVVAHSGGGDANEARVRLCEAGRRGQRGRGAGKNKQGGQSKAHDFCIHPKRMRPSSTPPAMPSCTAGPSRHRCCLLARISAQENELGDRCRFSGKKELSD